jgi:TM2 domain-containing membrane protein YozV
MKPATRAALLSGAVFPGLGQMYLKRYLRGAIIMVLTVLALSAVIYIATVAVLESLSNIQIENGVIDTNAIVNLSGLRSGHNTLYLNISSYFIVCCWVFSIVDAYSIGKQKDLVMKKN